MDIRSKIKEVPDWPRRGINFKDITPLLEDAKSLKIAIQTLVSPAKRLRVDKVLGIESRGFLLAAPVAYSLNTGLIIARKKGKLPRKTLSVAYSLEYGQAVLEMHRDSIRSGEQVWIVDDVLATGGTAKAAAKLVETAGGQVAGFSFLIELTGLKGRKQLKDYFVCASTSYEY